MGRRTGPLIDLILAYVPTRNTPPPFLVAFVLNAAQIPLAVAGIVPGGPIVLWFILYIPLIVVSGLWLEIWYGRYDPDRASHFELMNIWFFKMYHKILLVMCPGLAFFALVLALATSLGSFDSFASLTLSSLSILIMIFAYGLHGFLSRTGRLAAAP